MEQGERAGLPTRLLLVGDALGRPAIYLAQMRATIDALGSVPRETLSVQTQDSLLAAFRGLRS